MNILENLRDVGPQVNDFINGLPPSYVESVDRLAGQLETHGNRQFHHTMPRDIACVPVELDRENLLETTLSRLAVQAQYSQVPLSIVASGNYTPSEFHDERTIARNTALLDDFGKANRNIPFSYFLTQNEAGISIGEVCDHLFIAAIRQYQQKTSTAKEPVRDILLSRWDADTVNATPTYHAQLQQHYDASDVELWMGYPYLRHDRLDETLFPAANRLLAWGDLAQYVGKSSGPAHFAINLGGFALGDGFQNGSIGEHTQMYMRAHARLERDPLRANREHLPHTMVTVSARRLVAQMARSRMPQYAELRARPAGGPHNQMPTLKHDVSEQYFNQVLPHLLRNVMENAYSDRKYELRKTGLYDVGDQAVEFARQTVRAGAFVFGNIHDTQRLTKKVIKMYYPFW